MFSRFTQRFTKPLVRGFSNDNKYIGDKIKELDGNVKELKTHLVIVTIISTAAYCGSLYSILIKNEKIKFTFK